MLFTELSIEEESSRFLKHLQLPDNNKIILSGIFGIGKSYFIDNFFKINSDKYVFIKLDPVNYSVSQNEDIFELIKFDIAFQLLGKEIDFTTVEIDKNIAAQYYLINNYGSTIKLLVENLSKLNRQVDSIVKSTLQLKDTIENYREGFIISEEEELERFLQSFSLKAGTYREQNSITELITILIQKLRHEDQNKEIVLVIDDLDRIDPEHIFRILNIFSAHFDYYNYIGKNKFDFDKILIICDVKNIRQIFHSKYGSNTDFSGYLDKFYSHNIFEYGFKNILSKNLSKFLTSIKLSGDSDLDHLGGSNIYSSELLFLLKSFVEVNALNIRTLIKFLRNTYESPSYSISLSNSSRESIHSSQNFSLIIFDFLIKLYGDHQSLNKAIDMAIKSQSFITISKQANHMDVRLGSLIMFIDCEVNNFQRSEAPRNYYYEELNMSFEYKINGNPSGYRVYGECLNVRRGEISNNSDTQKHYGYDIDRVPYFQLLKRAFEKFQSLRKKIN